MSALHQFMLFAEYNRLMNQRQFAAAACLSEEELHKDQKAFFKSVFGTLNHILLGDIIWLKRFSEHPTSQYALSYIVTLEKPTSLDVLLFEDLTSLKVEREKVDQIIIHWIASLTEMDMDDCIAYTNIAGVPFKKPYESLISHLFMHQVHHRGQVTTLLSQNHLDFGETDLIEIINACDA